MHHGPGFDDLLDLSAADELLSERGLRTPFVRVARDGVVAPAAGFTRGGGAGASIADQLADDRLADLLVGGSTVVLQGLHRTWPPVGAFARALTAELGQPVQVNAYLTPPQGRGFTVHYDTHDVFVAQVSGTKRWRIHPALLPAPLPHQGHEQYREQVEAAARHEPYLDVDIGPGDSLYLPRGWLHAAEARGPDPSLHLTFGVHVVTGVAVLRAAATLAEDDPELRAALPPGRDLGGATTAGDRLRAAAAVLVGLADERAEDVLREVRIDRDRATRPAPVPPLAHAAAVHAFDDTTPLALRAQLGVELRRSGGHVELVSAVHGPTVLTSAQAEALRPLLSGAVASAKDLAAPPDLLAVLADLLRAGVLVVATAP
ncbi:MAG TPA: cupin domain-containing protein [Candidatus Nanopelagicales bacterium]|nr:cupin domain-containing protein [Candidatus Nanopelagicales bacterium]